jgi:RNA polymerase sigma-32 factor
MSPGDADEPRVSMISALTNHRDPDAAILEPEIVDEDDLDEDELLADDLDLDEDDPFTAEDLAELVALDQGRALPNPAPMAAIMPSLPALPDEYALMADPLAQYLARLRFVEPLPGEQQQALAILYKQDGDLVAAQKLVLTNLRLVVKIAREYQRRWANLLDLIQEGNVGLAEAVRRYDPYRGVKFTSYAQYWIRAMILNYLMNHFQPVKIGSTRAGRKLFYNLKKAREQLRRQGFLATPNLIADMLGVDEAEVVRVSEYLDAPPLSIDARAPGYEKTTYGDLLPSDTRSPEESAARAEVDVQIADTIRAFGHEELTIERERAIWFERMIAEDPRSLIELGDRFQVSKERIRQIEVQIRNRFKKYLLDRHGDAIEFEFLQTD